MTERNERDARRRRSEPEMSLHDGRGRPRMERSAPYGRKSADVRYEDRKRVQARRYEELYGNSGRYGDRRRRPARRRKRRGCLGRILLMALVIALLIAGVFMAEKLAGRLMPKIREEYCPVKYEDLIRTYAAQNGLEPAHVAAVILTESSYDPQAVSGVGARGLMQLMPATADWIAGKLGEKITEEQLFDPETNIRFGCYYLGFLMERYDDDMTCVTAAYHAGHGTVDRWLKNEEYSADGETLAVIASDVTNTYVSRVLRRYEKYSEIYMEEP